MHNQLTNSWFMKFPSAPESIRVESREVEESRHRVVWRRVLDEMLKDGLQLVSVLGANSMSSLDAREALAR